MPVISLVLNRYQRISNVSPLNKNMFYFNPIALRKTKIAYNFGFLNAIGLIKKLYRLCSFQVNWHHADIIYKSFCVIFVFFNRKCRLFFTCFESPHWGDSNENTQCTIFNIKKENHPQLSQIWSYHMGFFPKGFENELEIAVVNEPSVFEPLKVYCISCFFGNTWFLTLKIFTSLYITSSLDLIGWIARFSNLQHSKLRKLRFFHFKSCLNSVSATQCP